MKKTDRIVGIVGGLGPLAGVDLVRKLVRMEEVSCDQEHASWILLNLPSEVPDRTQALLHGGEDFVQPVVDQLVRLKEVGVDFGAIACNTSHARLDAIRNGSPIPVLDMIGETVHYIAEFFSPGAKIGILGTDGTLQLGLYDMPLQNADFLPLHPSTKRQPQQATNAIKRGDVVRGREILQECVDDLIQQGAEAVVLGCTEYPIALTEVDGLLIDPTEILAGAILRECRK